MEFKLNIGEYLEDAHVKIDCVKFQKMLLLFNAIEDGWTIKKREESFVFTKNHEGKKEILQDSYLTHFMKTNLNPTNILDINCAVSDKK